jgi:hypothetical protein
MSAIGAVVLVLAIAVLEPAGQDQSGREWLRSPPAKSFAEWTPVPEKDVYEVVASKEIIAVLSELSGKPWIALSEGQARYYTGHYFQKTPGQRTFLVRAVYGQGGTGGYSVSRRGSEVHVSHGSLGRSDASHKSALVVNLDFVPQQLFVTASVDQ